MKYHAIFFTDMSSRLWHARPLGAYRLATELRRQGYNVLVVDFLSKWLLDLREFDKLLKLIISDQTLFVGYSGTFFSRNDDKNVVLNSVDDFHEYKNHTIGTWPVDKNTIKLINQRIKSRNPEVKIFYGGAWASVYPEDLTHEISGVDYIVQGFADAYIVDIMNKLKAKEYIAYSPENNCKVIKYDVTGAQFDFVNSSQTIYHESDCLSNLEVLPIETSRGCMFKCKFCSFPLLGRKKSDTSYHKHTSVLSQELKHNYEAFGINRYMFVDDTFNESTAKLQEIHDAIQQSGVDIKFFCYLRLDLIERYPEQIELLKNMGMQSAFLGLETLNPKSARAVGKNSDPESVKNTLELMRTILGDQCSLHASLIIGLPHETEETIDQWMSWIYERSDLLDSFNAQPLNLNKKDTNWPSEITRDPEKYGYTADDPMAWVNNTGMTRQTAVKLSEIWLHRSWTSGRLKVGGFDILGMQNLNFSFEELRHQQLNQLPMDTIKERYHQKFKNYQQKLYMYINQ
jgi:radical SAM superfamily enzyme YgiQ (UPF0313 family)